MLRLAFTAPVWRWSGEAAWHFATLPDDLVAEVRLHVLSGGLAPPGGMVRVEAGIAGVTWKTSLFQSKDQGYLLPIKAEVRRRARIGAGDEVRISLHLAE